MPRRSRRRSSGRDHARGLIAKIEAEGHGFGRRRHLGAVRMAFRRAGASWRRTHATPLRELTYTFGYYFGQSASRPMIPSASTSWACDRDEADGGKTSPRCRAAGASDYHAWWIDPNDAGAWSRQRRWPRNLDDGGKSWLKLDRSGRAVLHPLALDMADPYNIAGAAGQRHAKGPSTSRWETGEQWSAIGGGDGMHVAVDRATTRPVRRLAVRFTTPRRERHEVRPPRDEGAGAALQLERRDPVAAQPDIVYFGAKRLFRSMDQGETWAAISGDLTTSRRVATCHLPRSRRERVAEAARLLWAGTDDGHVWSRRRRRPWQQVDAGLVGAGEQRGCFGACAGPRHLALKATRNDDATPYLYATTTLARLAQHCRRAARRTVNVVREIPSTPTCCMSGATVACTCARPRRVVERAVGGPANVPCTTSPCIRVSASSSPPRTAAACGSSMSAGAGIFRGSLGAVHVFPLEPVDAARDGVRARRIGSTKAKTCRGSTFICAKARGAAEISIVDEHGARCADSRSMRSRASTACAGTARRPRPRAWRARVRKPAAASVAGKSAAHARAGTLSRTPYAESVRLGHRLFAAPGKYNRARRARRANRNAHRDQAPEARKPRAKPPLKIRAAERGCWRAQQSPTGDCCAQRPLRQDVRWGTMQRTTAPWMAQPGSH